MCCCCCLFHFTLAKFLTGTMAAETIVAPSELLDCSSWLQCLLPSCTQALLACKWGAGLGVSSKVGKRIQGEVDDGFLPAEESEVRDSVSQSKLWWERLYWDFTDTLSIPRTTSRKQLLSVSHSREWAMKPHIKSAVTHTARLKLILLWSQCIHPHWLLKLTHLGVFNSLFRTMISW